MDLKQFYYSLLLSSKLIVIIETIPKKLTRDTTELSFISKTGVYFKV